MEVTLIDHMGSDLTVANAARVSFNKESDWDYGGYCEQCNDWHEPVLPKSDKKLIKYLADHNHWTPFSHCMITVREKVPLFVARQRFKHVVGFSYNEVSRRYVSDEPEFFVPSEWRMKAENKKQGSSDEALPYEIYGEVFEQYYEALRACEQAYDYMIENGVAPEMARMVLPQSTYTEYYCTGSLAAFARAYKLRIDSYAQKEIQDLAVKWDEIIRPLFPESWSALVD